MGRTRGRSQEKPPMQEEIEIMATDVQINEGNM